MRIDWFMLSATLALACFGVVLQAHVLQTAPALAPLVVGGLVFAGCAVLCTGERAARTIRGRGMWIAWGVAVALMGALLVFGRRYRGGLYLPGRLNPSELVKLCTAAFAAAWFAERRSGRAWGCFVAACALLGGEVVLAGDFGLLVQLVLTGTFVLFASSWWKGGAALAAIVCGFLFVSAHPTGHLATRFAVWRDPLEDMTGAGWQTLQGLASVVSGGVSGVGLAEGDMDLLPMASNDFVYAALAKDFGLLGCAVVLGLWLLILLRGLVVAARRDAAGDACGALFATGLVASLGTQTLLNVAGVLNALPMTGITLPLVSQGGASFVVTLAMCGALTGLSRRCRGDETLVDYGTGKKKTGKRKRP